MSTLTDRLVLADERDHRYHEIRLAPTSDGVARTVCGADTPMTLIDLKEVISDEWVPCQGCAIAVGRFQDLQRGQPEER